MVNEWGGQKNDQASAESSDEEATTDNSEKQASNETSKSKAFTQAVASASVAAIVTAPFGPLVCSLASATGFAIGYISGD